MHAHNTSGWKKNNNFLCIIGFGSCLLKCYIIYTWNECDINYNASKDKTRKYTIPKTKHWTKWFVFTLLWPRAIANDFFLQKDDSNWKQSIPKYIKIQIQLNHFPLPLHHISIWRYNQEYNEDILNISKYTKSDRGEIRHMEAPLSYRCP